MLSPQSSISLQVIIIVIFKGVLSFVLYLGQPTALEKGDLVRLGFDQTGETLMKTMWCSGTNERNKKEGEFPLDSLYILPTLSKPSQDILVY